MRRKGKMSHADLTVYRKADISLATVAGKAKVKVRGPEKAPAVRSATSSRYLLVFIATQTKLVTLCTTITPANTPS